MMRVVSIGADGDSAGSPVPVLHAALLTPKAGDRVPRPSRQNLLKMGQKPRSQGLSGLRYIGVGLSFGAFVGVGGYLGYLCEGWLHTGPWLRLVGILAGVALGTYDLIRTAEALERREKEEEEQD
jgi:Putative F0F1-ATPase subunit Ca2+/Mg2+ transporter